MDIPYVLYVCRSILRHIDSLKVFETRRSSEIWDWMCEDTWCLQKAGSERAPTAGNEACLQAG